MLSPEQIHEANRAKVNAIFEKFLPLEPETNTQVLRKSETTQEPFWTKEGLVKYKQDLFKALDEGTLTDVELSKAEQDLLSLTKEERQLGGELKTVFVRKRD